MGFISNFFDSSKGNGWQAQGTQIDKPVTVDQANQGYNQAQTGLQQQMAFLQALQGAGGIQNQASVFNQLQGVASGQGPNPAMAALNNATGQNVANTAALMAGQRGANANAGLIARQAAQQGANIQQDAAGQAAALQANQSLNAMGQLGGIANQQVNQQGQAAQGYTQSALANQQNLYGQLSNQNQAAVNMQSNINNANAGIAQENAKSQNKMVGGLMEGVGSFIGLAEGGPVPMQGAPAQPAAPMSFDEYLQSYASGGQVQPAAKKVPVLLSPGEKAVSPKEAMNIAKGKESVKSAGKTVPGKAPVKGDNPKNDIVKAHLQPGAFVIPKSVMESKDPEKSAAAFVRAHMSRSEGLSSKKKKAA